MLRRLILLAIMMAALLGLVACQAPARPQEMSATPTSAVVAETTPASTLTPEQELTNVTDWSQVAGQEGDLYVLGNPDAPLRIVDYSDFL